MTDKAVSALTSLTGANTATGDLLYIVDISEAAAADRSKKITAQELQNYLKTFPATIGVGGATPAASGAGISFPATVSASSDANTLDDYEEGTWSGTLLGGGANPTTPVTATGKYTKIGQQVTVAIYFNNVDTTGAVGAAYIAGLPFTEDGTRYISTVATYNFDFNTGTSLCGDISSTSIYLLASKDDAGWVDVNHNAGANRYLRISGTYFV